MSPSERIEILKRKDHRGLNSPRLKPTPDLVYSVPVLDSDELDEAKLIFEYEQDLQAQKSKRGY